MRGIGIIRGLRIVVDIRGRFDTESLGVALGGSVRRHLIHGARRQILESKSKMISVSARTWIPISVGFSCETTLKTGWLDVP